jgi:hypothetical protein
MVLVAIFQKVAAGKTESMARMVIYFAFLSAVAAGLTPGIELGVRCFAIFLACSLFWTIAGHAS